MRIISMTRLATCFLVLMALSLAGILSWGLDKLNQSFVSTLNYSELQRQLAVDVRNKIQTYLSSGDATFHMDALADLEHLQQHIIPSLPPRLAEQLKPLANALHSGLSNEFLGAGKLAGDEQALLYQNERETGAELQRLEAYALKVIERQPTTGIAYLHAVVRLTELLSEIKTLRENFWSSGKQNHLQQLTKTQERYKDALQQVSRLPRIGVYPEQAKDEIASLMGWSNQARSTDIEEQGDEILRQLSSLHQRYPLEMQRSIEGLQARTTSSAQVNQLINNFEHAIIQGQQQIHHNKDKIEALVKKLFFAFAIGLLIIAALLYLFQQRFVINNLTKLESALTILVKQGSLNFVEMETERTELGQIAKRFNQLIAGMKQQQLDKNQQLQEVGVTLEQLLGSFDSIITNAQTTLGQLHKAGESSQALNLLAQQVNHSSAQVKSFAEETEQLMHSSEKSAGEVVSAGEQAIQKTELGQQSLLDLVQAVQQVMGILDQIKHISEQTNLLAINAAIEAAHAGENGHAFSVVADEVRQLSKKTHSAVSQSTDVLGALNKVTDRVKQHIDAVAHSTEFQCQLARTLQATSLQVRERSFHASLSAQQSSNLTEQQYQRVADFNQQIKNMEQGAQDANHEVTQLRIHVSQQIGWLRTHLGV